MWNQKHNRKEQTANNKQTNKNRLNIDNRLRAARGEGIGGLGRKGEGIEKQIGSYKIVLGM